MNLGGIKVSSVEIERCCNTCMPEVVAETAAIAIRPVGGGPSLLVMVVMTRPGSSGISISANTTGAALAQEEQAFKQKVRTACQNAIKTKLNPLFHISDVVLVDILPRTASNKIMRRVLRDQYVDARDRAIGGAGLK
jgi:acetyl-CoA synthetase